FLAGHVVILALAFCKLFAVYLNIWASALRETYSIEYEGHVFWAVEQLARGMNIYNPATLSSEPWAVVIYNPLFICLGAAATSIFGMEFWVLRLITITAACFSVAGLHLLMRRSGSGILAALTADAFFLAFMPVAYWSCLSRVDFLGL